MIDVDLSNFEAQVLSASTHTPVLLDVWAPWCGPCQSLAPTLEALEAEYAGRFVLARLNADEVPQIAAQLSQMLGVRSIPLCVLFAGGQPVDAFVGAQPAESIRAFLDKHVPSEDAIAAEGQSSEADALLAAGDTQAALAMLAAALTQDPANDDVRARYVRLLIETGALAQAAEALREPLGREPQPLRFAALRCWLDAREFVASAHERAHWQPQQFDELIAASARDFEARLQKAHVLMDAQQWEAAMDELLEVVMRDKAWGNEAARRHIVAILEILSEAPAPEAPAPAAESSAEGAIHLTGHQAADASPQAQLISRYRRRLSMALH